MLRISRLHRDPRESTARRTVRWLRLRYLDYKPRPDDIFLAAYPRSGCNWLQQIVAELHRCSSCGDDALSGDAFPGGALPGSTLPGGVAIEWFERLVEGQAVEQMPAPRIFRTHLSYQDFLFSIPKGPARYIYLIRDGRDVLRSYYRYAVSQTGYRGDFDSFFHLFMRGRLPYGSWFDHVAGWWEQRAENILLLNFEDLVHNLPGVVRRIANFCSLQPQEACLPDLLERCKYARIKKQEERYDGLFEPLPGGQGLTQSGDEIRTTLTPEQEAKFCQVLQRRFGDSVYDPGIMLGAPRAGDGVKRKLTMPK